MHASIRAAEERKPPPGFFVIKLFSLRSDTIASFDIYIMNRKSEQPTLFRARTLPITSEVLQRLTEAGHARLYVPASQEADYRVYIEQHLEVILQDEAIPVEARSDVLYDSAKCLMQDVFENPRSAAMVKRSKDLVANTAAFLSNEKSAFEHMLSLVSYDYYTYTHSVNVFVFSFALAQRAGFTDAVLLQQFGEGALLHDVGKSMLDPAIIRSRGALDGEQWRQMRLHPVYGYDILKAHEGLSDLALDVVRHHHEKLDGTGYPDGLRGDEIHPLVRISTIADIFDALTTCRPYKHALQSYPALLLMRDEMQGELDPHYFGLFIELMGNPSG